ncbi:MAG: Ig-like domain repeat protein [Deltaproteobacteria bacterium]|nr:Ig-like domain repeat protein [Deltaproteobacteria bacterium]
MRALVAVICVTAAACGDNGPVDLPGPTTVIDGGPPAVSAQTHVEVRFHADDASATFTCALDGGAPAACTSPHAFDVTDGVHALAIVASRDGVAGAPAVASFTVDTIAPDTVITVAPSDVETTAVASFTFAASPAADGAAFECAIDGNGFTPCSSPATVTRPDGPHTFAVRAIDAAGNVDSTPATHGWTIDTVGPVLLLTQRPPNPSNVATPTFVFSSPDPTATFTCQIDGVTTFTACSSPFTTPPLADGLRTFRLRATDAAAQHTDLSYAWTVDTIAPTVTITSGPSGATATATPVFAFSVSADATAITCAIDTGAFAPCTSPFTTPTLGQGPHTFAVRATDAATNTATATRSFTVDTIAPTVTITSGPVGPTNVNTPAWTFTVTDAPTTIECRIDAAAFAPCTSPFAPGTLADGNHAFTVRVADAAGNQGSDSRAIAVDTVAPVVTITGGPTGVVEDTTPTFTFTINEGLTVGQCRIDAGAFVPCTSPFTTSTLGGGPHVFEVTATDPAGNTGRATRSFTVDSAAPSIAITSGPPAFTNNATPTFAFVAGPTATTVECRVDGGAFAACTSPFTTATLSEAAHTFEVRACTAVPVCASDTRTFTVDVTPPGLTITAGPEDPTPTRETQPTFAFTATAANTVTCRITNAAAPNPPAVPCTATFAPTALLADGAHVFEVVASDTAGNTTTRTRAFTVDTRAPTIAVQPPAIPARPSNKRPVLHFSVTDASSVTVTCAVDTGAAVPCDGAAGFSSPSDLADGLHTYHVKATDAATNQGTLDATFTVDTTPPTVTITSGPPDPTNNNTPTFAFTTDGVRARCAMDTGEVIDPCTSGVTFPPLAPGVHTFTLTAFDDATPANSASVTYPFTLGACGDGAAQGSEQCDGGDLRGQTCAGLGFTAGTLSCSSSCTFVTSACTTCGNNIVEPGEQCDRNQLAGGTCTSEGFDSGTIACVQPGNPGACTFDTTGCGTCGNGIVDGTELCDGNDFRGAACPAGSASPTPACNSTCNAVDASACDGGFLTANTGYGGGQVCLDGLRACRSNVCVAACTTDQGAWKLPRSVSPAGLLPLTQIGWQDANGGATSFISNRHGRSVSIQPENGSTAFLSDNSLPGNNGFRSSLFENTIGQVIAWSSQALFVAGAPAVAIEAFSARLGAGGANNVVGGWHPTLGAIALRGFTSTAPASPIGAGVTGTVTSIATGSFGLPSNDLMFAVFGQTPTGDAATGGGIYWSCNFFAATPAAFTRLDNGIPEADKARVWSLTPDPASFTTAVPRVCPATGQMVTGHSTIAYAALRGGGQIYKTVDGGATWSQSNSGIPAGAEVFAIAIDCSRFVAQAGFEHLCPDRNRLYAATSAGLFRSSNAGTTWIPAGFAGKSVRAIALQPEHPVGTEPWITVGVDDAVKIYQRLP